MQHTNTYVNEINASELLMLQLCVLHVMVWEAGAKGERMREKERERERRREKEGRKGERSERGKRESKGLRVKSDASITPCINQSSEQAMPQQKNRYSCVWQNRRTLSTIKAYLSE